MATSLTLRQPFAAAQIVHWEFSISIVPFHLRKASVGRPTLAKLALSWVHCVLLAMACARLPGSIQLVKTLDASLDVRTGLLWALHSMSYPVPLSSRYLPWQRCMSPAAIFNDQLCSKLPFEVTCAAFSCLVLLDAFATALNLRRTHQGHGLNFRELMYGRIEMMTALFPACACDSARNTSGGKPSGYPKHKKKFPTPPNCRTFTRLTGNDSPGRRLFIDGGFERQVDGSDLSGWRIAAASPDDFVRILCGPVVCSSSPSGIF